MHVHSLLHCNLNTADLASAASFYADLLGLRPGLKTARQPSDGRGLGFDGMATSEAWFLFDRRGPRISPGLEVMEWETPPLVGEHPTEPHHIGLSAIGFRVPADGRHDEDRVRDLDGVPVELVPSGVDSPSFSHVRLNCSDLERSVEWYVRLGFSASAPIEAGHVRNTSVQAGEAAPFSIELTQWQDPAPVGAAPAVANHRGLYRIALGVEDIRAAYDELAASGGEPPQPLWVELPGTKLGGVTVMFLHDPDNVVVELVERPAPR